MLSTAVAPSFVLVSHGPSSHGECRLAILPSSPENPEAPRRLADHRSDKSDVESSQGSPVDRRGDGLNGRVRDLYQSFLVRSW